MARPSDQEIRRVLKDVQETLLLKHWRIVLKKEKTKDKELEAEILPNNQYLKADLFVHDVEEGETLENVIAHELTHVLLSPVMDFAASQMKTKEQLETLNYFEDQCVEHLVRIFEGLRK